MHNLLVHRTRDWHRSGKRFGLIDKSKREIGFAAIFGDKEGVKRKVAWNSQNNEKCTNHVCTRILLEESTSKIDTTLLRQEN